MNKQGENRQHFRVCCPQQGRGRMSSKSRLRLIVVLGSLSALGPLSIDMYLPIRQHHCLLLAQTLCGCLSFADSSDAWSA